MTPNVPATNFTVNSDNAFQKIVRNRLIVQKRATAAPMENVLSVTTQKNNALLV
jgi:hypothetical protein